MSSDSSERSDKNNDDDDGTGAEDKKFYGDGDGDSDGRGDRNTGAGGGSAEWMGFLIPIALLETFGAMAKVKASLSTKLRKTRSWEKTRINSMEGKGCKEAHEELIKNNRKK